MGFSFSFEPLIPWPWVWALAALFALVVCIGALRGVKGWPLRILSAAFILLALLTPMTNQEDRDPLSNIIFVVADKTASQSVSDRPAQIEAALARLAQEIGTLDGFEIREVVVENDLSARDDGSFVLGALSKAAAEVAQARIGGAIIITDGRIHDADVLGEFPAPVHVLRTGRAADWDKRLVLINAPSFAIVDEEIKLRLRIDEQGAVPSTQRGEAVLSIDIDGENYGTFPLPTNRELELPIKLAHGGVNVIQFNVHPEEGEVTHRNNSAVLSINGVRDRLRVLLVSGEPHSGERTWRNLLKSDSAVDLVHFTILRPPEKLDGVPVSELSLIAFPVRQLFLEKIEEFDLIIFDRYKRRGMLSAQYLRNVVQYVKNGGAVLVASGESFAGAESLFRTDLAEIIPARPTARVIERGFHPMISSLGQRHPVTQDLERFAPPKITDDDTPSWGRWFRLIEAEPLRGDVVMTGAEGKPLLLLDRIEEGRVALLLSDHAWLWSRGFEGGGPQLELLRRLAHWAMKEPDLEEERLSARSDGNQITITRRSVLDSPRDLQVQNPDGSLRALEMQEHSPGQWIAQFEGTENGLYRLYDGDQEAVIALGPTLPREFEQTLADGVMLKPLRRVTGGGEIGLEEVPSPDLRIVRAGRVAAGEQWLGLVDRQSYVTLAVRQAPVFPAWFYLIMAAGFAILGWWIEGRRRNLSTS
ncbi:membrane protein [Amylibacter marinus]|uniref:Membrane protein n=1 Tax=Amylibacter marinus TaxID=1475483 RepID=A0ABQ5VVK7_9RHOB|nr:hypothetical protein [Amylibacter marinus]GLQ35222.1 membrane protein [Amylibacter marinus]